MLQIKGNQPTLRAYLRACHAADPTPAGACHQQQQRRNGQQQAWTTSVYDGAQAPGHAAWPGLARLVVVVKTVTARGQCHTHTRYYLTSLRHVPVAELATGIRGHWGIENKLHRTRDVHFGQDANGIRHPAAAAMMALLNTLALNHLLSMDQSVSFAQISFAQNIKQFLATQRT